MNITDVRIRRMGEEGKMKAVASVTFDDEFVVHDIKIIDGQNGLFIAMPSRKVGEGDFRDVAHPLKSETRAKIKDAILPNTTDFALRIRQHPRRRHLRKNFLMQLSVNSVR